MPGLISSKELVIEDKKIPVKIVDENGSQMANIIIASDQVRELVYWWIGRAITAPVRGVAVGLRHTMVFVVEEWETTVTDVQKARVTQQVQRSADIFNSFRDEILRVLQDPDSPEELKEIYVSNLKKRMQERFDKMK
ncbi:MAG: hypothetical protein RLZZ338_1437 [Cyanobacteriota bacterium]|jgi:hypothetical protein